jgi:hypothetical protein
MRVDILIADGNIVPDHELPWAEWINDTIATGP